jgi:dolichol-phosphate mannosyltransferase
MPARLSIIVPTLNEAENLPELVVRLGQTLTGVEYEIIVVDDGSTDGTRRMAIAMSRRFPIRLLERKKPADGLAGAVMMGLAAAAGELLVVMDADLQHPPEQIPCLLEPLCEGRAEFVLGSRYVAGGRIVRGWGMFRRLNSWIATALAWPVVRGICDPMSGFFAMRRSVLARAAKLHPRGFKIALELLCRCDVRHVTERPILFGTRRHGESKLRFREQFQYATQLFGLYAHMFARLFTHRPITDAPEPSGALFTPADPTAYVSGESIAA